MLYNMTYFVIPKPGWSEVVLQDKWPLENVVDFPFLYEDQGILGEESSDEPEPRSLDIHTGGSLLKFIPRLLSVI